MSSWLTHPSEVCAVARDAIGIPEFRRDVDRNGPNAKRRWEGESEKDYVQRLDLMWKALPLDKSGEYVLQAIM